MGTSVLDQPVATLKPAAKSRLSGSSDLTEAVPADGSAACNMASYPFLSQHENPELTKQGFAQCTVCLTKVNLRRKNAAQDHLVNLKHTQAVQKINHRLQLFPWLTLDVGNRHRSRCKFCPPSGAAGEGGVPWRNLQKLREHQESVQHFDLLEKSVLVEPCLLSSEGILVRGNYVSGDGFPEESSAADALDPLATSRTGADRSGQDLVLIHNKEQGTFLADELIDLRIFGQGIVTVVTDLSCNFNADPDRVSY